MSLHRLLSLSPADSPSALAFSRILPPPWMRFITQEPRTRNPEKGSFDETLLMKPTFGARK